MSLIHELVSAVRQPEFYVPRDYQTMGGRWTVDTWRRAPVQVQSMDEGYTTIVTAPGLRVVLGYNGQQYVRYEQGNYQQLPELMASFERSNHN